MFSVRQLFEPRWQRTLADYVTAIVWSPEGDVLAASSAAGEVVVQGSQTVTLQAAGTQSVDCLAFSRDGQYLAAGGQSGRVTIWRIEDAAAIATLDNAPAWVDQMAWNPVQNQLAFSLGKFVQVWDASVEAVVATLNFDHSSVLDLTWHPDGDRLTVSGYQGVKIWTANDWDDDPYLLTIPSASVAIAWSPDGHYIACGNLDRTITVLEWENPDPWVMRGFPGKIRRLAWSKVSAKQEAPLLASATADSVVVWEKHSDDRVGWEGRVLDRHEGTVQAIDFQPGTTLLASAGEDGQVNLWHSGMELAQSLGGAPNGFSCLAWHPQGRQLAAGGQDGELQVWSQT